MGTVYAGCGPDGRPVAVKLLHPFRAASAQGLARFRREVAALSRVRHPAIVPVLASDLDGEEPYLVMPLRDGMTLADIVIGFRRRDPDTLEFLVGSLPELRGVPPSALEPSKAPWIAAVVRMGADLAQALAAAHGAGLVHRDLKPANVMVDRAGGVHLLDFGLVWDDEACDQGLTRSDERMGTPLYMSPEQVHPRWPVDHRSDLYGLGLALYEALALDVPLEGSDLTGLYRAILETTPRRLNRVNPGVDEGLASVVESLLRKHPDHRYQDAVAVARDLGRVSRGDAPSPPRGSAGKRMRLVVAAVVGVAGVLLSVFLLGGERAVDPSLDVSLDSGRVAAASGDYTSAVSAFQSVLAREPGHEGAVAGLRSVALGLAERAASREAAFCYDAAAEDLEALARLAPEAAVPSRVERLLSVASRTLADVASRALPRDAPLVDRLRALEDLRESADPRMSAEERARLLCALLEQEGLPPRLAASVLDVASVLRIHQVAPAARVLLDEDQPFDVRLAAAEFLAVTRDALGRERLEAWSLADGPHVDRAFETLATVAPPESVPVFVHVVETGTDRAAAQASSALVRVGRKAFGPGQAERLDAALGRRFLNARTPALKAILLQLAGIVEGRESLGLLVAAAEDLAEPVAVRRTAAEELGRSRTPVARRSLLRVLSRDPVRDVRGAAALALEGSGGEAHGGLVDAAVGDPDGEVRARALVALARGRAGNTLPLALEILAGSADLRVRVGAILSLGFLDRPDPRVLQRLTALLREASHPHERLGSAWALGELGDPSALPALMDVLRDEAVVLEAHNRASAVLREAGSGLAALVGQLAEIGLVAGHVATLARSEAHGDLAEAVIAAIGALVPAASPQLQVPAVNLLLDVAGSGGRDNLRAAAITVLGRLGALPLGVRETLTVMLRSEARRSVRRSLALALTRLGVVSAGEAWLTETPLDGEDALVRALILIRLDREGEALDSLVLAVRLRALDRVRMAIEPELRGIRLLMDMLGLLRD
jgi:HEAT repeat protein